MNMLMPKVLSLSHCNAKLYMNQTYARNASWVKKHAASTLCAAPHVGLSTAASSRRSPRHPYFQCPGLMPFTSYPTVHIATAGNGLDWTPPCWLFHNNTHHCNKHKNTSIQHSIRTPQPKLHSASMLQLMLPPTLAGHSGGC